MISGEKMLGWSGGGRQRGSASAAAADDAPKVVPRRSSNALHPSFTLALHCNHIFYKEFTVVTF